METCTPPVPRAMREDYTRERDGMARLSGGRRTLQIMAKRSKTAFRAAVTLAKADALVPGIVFLVFVLSRPYWGIVQDAHIYMGRALADLDPNGVGRDLMYIHDGQFGFSLFRWAAAAMVKCFGLGTAAKTLTILAAFAWFFGIRAFARQFASGATVWVAVLFAVLLPNAYGAPYPLGFAELIAIPRPFSEALVFAALATLAANRDAISIAFIAAAALLHPIMAMAGMGVWLTVRCVEDQRWVWLCALVGILLLVAGMQGLPLADRLFITINPSLRSLHEMRSPFLFPGLWPAESFPPLIVQATTLAIAAHVQQGRRRTILAAIMAVGLGGIVISAIFGDWLSSLLVVQAQLWRMAWLMAAVAAMALGVASVELWREGQNGRLVLAFLVLCWSFNTQFAVAGPAAILALLLHFRAGRFAPAIKTPVVLATWILTIAVATIWKVRLLAYHWHFFMRAPAGQGNFELLLVRGYLVLPLCMLAVYFAIAKPRLGWFLQGGVAALLLAAVFGLWDHRPPLQRLVEENQRPPEFMRLIDQRQGEVYWMDGQIEAWFILGRPQWASPLQGGPIIFSPVLAAEWRRRMQILMNLKLADQKSFTPWAAPASADVPRLSQDGVRRLCAQSDAPAFVIAPLEHGKEAPGGLDMKVWPLPQPQFLLTKADRDFIWRKIDAYGVIACGNTPHQ
ncbi:MAG TPA: hypothetical protein VL996_01230 [Methylocella sp.]|nr:hypothetical protein [Methylocella sp.]